MMDTKPTKLKVDDLRGYFYLGAIVLALVNNLEHLSTVHYRISQTVFPGLTFDILNKAHSGIAVLIFDITLLALILKGERFWTGVLSLAVLILNLVYYDVITLYEKEQWEKLTSAIIFSIVYSATPWAFAELYARRFNLDDEIQALTKQMWEFRASCTTLRAEVNNTKKQLQEAEAKVQELAATLKIKEAEVEQERDKVQQAEADLKQYRIKEQQQRAALTCPYCKEEQATDAQLRSHKGHCKHKSPVGSNHKVTLQKA